MDVFAIIVFLAVFCCVLIVYAGLQAAPKARRKKTQARLAGIPNEAAVSHADLLDTILRDDTLSSVAWVDRVLRKFDVLAELQTLLLQAESKWTVSNLIVYTAACAVGFFFLGYWRTATFAPSAIFGFVCGLAPLMTVYYQRSARLNKFEERLPEALDMMVSAIRAGHGIQAAIGTVAKETAAPISTEFRICHDEQTFGMDFRTSMGNLAQRVPLHDVQIMVTAILIQKESGGNLAEIVEKVAHIIRERFRLKREIGTRTAQGRLTGWVLALMPVVLGFSIFLVNPTYMEKLWQTDVGLNLLYGATVGTLIGGLIIRKIVNVRV
ncbi:MAG: type II secretion system F family protein [Bryobacteraceae bacterium]